MPSSLLIGILAGIVAAIMVKSATIGVSLSGILLSMLSMLPVFLAGFGWGHRAAVIAAATAAGVAAVLSGPMVAGIWLVTRGLPALVLCYFTFLSRTDVAAVDGDDNGAATTGGGSGGVLWYPVGRLVAVAAIIAGAMSAFSWLFFDKELGALRQGMTKQLGELVKKYPGPQPVDEAQLTKIVDAVWTLLPMLSAAVSTLIILLNLWLAGRIMRASGRLMRPWPDIASLRLPRAISFALTGTVLVSFVAGVPGLLASFFMGAFLCAYALMGLAIIHHVTRASMMRGFILYAVYAASILFIPYSMMLLAVIALAEPISPLSRRSKFPPRSGPPGPPAPPGPHDNHPNS